MQLYIVRHAWAENLGDGPYASDDERRLTSAGIDRFRRFVGRLLQRGMAFEHIATSPLVRCRQTAELLQELAPNHPPITELEALAPGASFKELAEWTQPFVDEDKSVVWVGHMPDVGRLTAELTGEPGHVLHFKKGEVACIEVEGAVARGCGRLKWMWNDKSLPV